MTNEMAIGEMKGRIIEIQRGPTNFHLFETEAMYKTAVAAMEKQVARKPVSDHHCPSCGWGMPVPEISDEWCKCCYFPSFCQHCGQAIDWEGWK